jgi:hypothetical protein
MISFSSDDGDAMSTDQNGDARDDAGRNHPLLLNEVTNPADASSVAPPTTTPAAAAAAAAGRRRASRRGAPRTFLLLRRSPS